MILPSNIRPVNIRPLAWLALPLFLVTGACGRGGSPPALAAVPVARAAAPVSAGVPVVAGTAVDRATPATVVRNAAVVFRGDSAVLPTVDSVAVDEPRWGLDVRSYETHDRVKRYVGLFSSGSGREHFIARLSRGTRYEPMIRAKLRAVGMPEELTYLALIESGYDPHAYSRAAAVGMWQFMSSSARGVGMRVDWWIDERRDPALATDGAIRLLRDLQRQFSGSLYLAAAAYNAGSGRVARGLTRFAGELDGAEGEDRFFALAEQDYLRAETKNYVPQLIAAALVAKMPIRYGLVIDTLPAYGYDSVRVEPGTGLASIAAASGTTKSELRDFNLAILRGITPPDASVWVRIPVGTAERARLALDSMPPDERRGFRLATVNGAGTTPAGFAERYGVSLKQLRAFNPALRTTKKGRLVAGQSLRVPRESALGLALDTPDPGITRYERSSPTNLSSQGLHVVKRGETVGSLARRYGLTEGRLRFLNGMRGSTLIAGQTIRVRSTSRATASTAPKVKAKKAAAKKATVKKATPAKKKARPGRTRP